MKQELNFMDVDLGHFDTESKTFHPNIDNVKSIEVMGENNCNNPEIMGSIEIVCYDEKWDWPIFMWVREDKITLSTSVSYSNRRKVIYLS
jgi:hypothetical protein